jgi:hypothetical protein
MMLVFFSGALAPIQNPFLGVVSKTLPLTWGITSLRAITITGSAAGLRAGRALLVLSAG